MARHSHAEKKTVAAARPGQAYPTPQPAVDTHISTPYTYLDAIHTWRVNHRPFRELEEVPAVR